MESQSEPQVFQCTGCSRYEDISEYDCFSMTCRHCTAILTGAEELAEAGFDDSLPTTQTPAPGILDEVEQPVH